RPGEAGGDHRRHRLGVAAGGGVRVPERGGRLRPPVRARGRPVHLGEADLQPACLPAPPRGAEEAILFALETYWPASDGWSAARIEEEVVVTADGCEVITKFPAEELLVAGQRYWAVDGPLPATREAESHRNRRVTPGRSCPRSPGSRSCWSCTSGWP